MAPKLAKQATAQELGATQLSGLHWAEGLIADKAARRAFASAEFRADDADKGGSLDRAEVVVCITRICKKFGLALPREEKIFELLDLCDKNNDGDLQESEFQGFFNAVIVSAAKKARQEFAKKHVKPIGGAKNGKVREILIQKPPKWYPADDIKPKEANEREIMSHGTAKLRKSITPGTVLILLGGRFRGKRVVFLKQLDSGLLMVTGPYRANGVPAKRCNQAYCIATSAKVDVSKVDLKGWTDADFGRKKEKAAAAAKKRKRGDGEEFFAEDEKKEIVSPEKVAKQKALDDVVMPAVEKVPMMAKYLKSLFSLSKADMPHKMKF